MAKAKTQTKKKNKTIVPEGLVKIDAGFNNILVTVTDPSGNTLCWSSAGKMGFKGSRKSTPFAGQLTGEDAARPAIDNHKMKSVDVEVKGPGAGRESALRALAATGLVIKTIKDTTPTPHNGCRPKKRRRV